MSSVDITKDIVFSVLQYLNEENFKGAAHELECESGLYFDLKHFEDMVIKGKWDEAENYLSKFTKVKDNNHSIKIYFEMRKQKYFEALDKKDHYKALDILFKDLKVFAEGNEGLFKDLSHLLIVDNIREIKPKYQNENFARKELMDDLKKVIEKHPLLKEKLKFPAISSDKLRNLLNESLKRDHLQNPTEAPEVLMANVSDSRPSSASQENSEGTALGLKPSTSEGPSMVFDEGDCGKVFGDVTPNPIEDGHNNSMNISDICEPSECLFLHIPANTHVNKIVRLTYTNAGSAIVALGANGMHGVWLWSSTSPDKEAKATTQFCPRIYKPDNGRRFMINDLRRTTCNNTVSCLALSKSDSYIISASGGMISVFNIHTFKTVATFMPPPPMVTSVTLCPEDNNIIAIGLADSSILIYFARKDKVGNKLEGHSKEVTGLAFSKNLKILISGDADSHIIVWNIDGWAKMKDSSLEIQGEKVLDSDTKIQFHPDQTNFLVVHNNNHLAIYEAIELKCVNKWVPEVPLTISQATFSCDGRSVYAIYGDGIVAMFDASNLQMHHCIYPSDYLPPTPGLSTLPISIAAHPEEPTQFAVGLTDGSIGVFEHPEQEGNWIVSQ